MSWTSHLALFEWVQTDETAMVVEHRHVEDVPEFRELLVHDLGDYSTSTKFGRMVSAAWATNSSLGEYARK